MHVRIDGHIRGEAIHIEWTEGAITGDLELVDRARRLHRQAHDEPIDEADPVAFINALEQVSCEHLEVRVGFDDTEDSRPGLTLW